MNINWKKLKKLAFKTIDHYSETADFIDQNREYFYTLLKFDLIIYLTIFSAALIIALSAFLGINLIGAHLFIFLSALFTPFLFLIMVVAYAIFSYGLTFGLVKILESGEKPSLNKIISEITENIGFVIQLTITGIIFSMVLAFFLLMMVGVLSVLDLIPLLSLSQLASKLIVAPAWAFLSFFYVSMSLEYLSGSRGWLKVPDKALKSLLKNEGLAYSLCLGLSLILSALPIFFNGLIFALLVYPLILIPLIQTITIIAPYVYLRK